MSKRTLLPTLVGYAVALAAAFFLVANASEESAAARGQDPLACVKDGRPVDASPT
jgi:hypothetical protein